MSGERSSKVSIASTGSFGARAESLSGEAQVYRRLYTETTTLCIRVPLQYKIWYLGLEQEKKSLIKKTMLGIIEGLATGTSQALGYTGTPVIINLNMNEQRVHVEIDPRPLEELILELYDIVEMLLRSSTMYKPALRNLAKRLQTIAKRLEEVKEKYMTN
ncbi:hypothetical protein PYJP_04020 [Pyrofollis japonicus]|uniref:hypothetical protein n=1 Tax=Pyrofollis japonicus TaxID=3060460 RepID=UPI00295B5BD4|nr:hypothetical protein [Pyrofollis japonicus]BEP17050.1 hypothetical protein PYJP_04020 [Pyrofollis japonicus]